MSTNNIILPNFSEASNFGLLFFCFARQLVQPVFASQKHSTNKVMRLVGDTCTCKKLNQSILLLLNCWLLNVVNTSSPKHEF